MLLDAFVSVMTDFVLSVVDNERVFVVTYLVATRLVLILRKRARENGAGAMVVVAVFVAVVEGKCVMMSKMSFRHWRELAGAPRR